MCVICVKDEKAKMPDELRMRDMFSANSDGAGFMFVRNKKVIIRKGFMKFKHFMKALEQEGITDEDTVVMHFRIATAGSASPKNCHPFPLSEELSDLRALRLETDVAMAHNGILSYEHDKKNDLSDTMSYTRDILADKTIKKNLFDASVFTLIEMSIGTSKMVFLDKDKRFVLLGDWVKDTQRNDGLAYSNLYFKARSTTYGNFYNGGKGYFDRETRTWVENTEKKEVGGTRVTTYRYDEKLGKLVPEVLPPLKETTTCETIVPVKENDLDKDAYLNETKAEKFGRQQRDNIEFMEFGEIKCPRCGHEAENERSWFCKGCGVTLYRVGEEMS